MGSLWKKSTPLARRRPLLMMLYSLTLFKGCCSIQWGRSGAIWIEEMSESWSFPRLEFRKRQNEWVSSVPLLGKCKVLCHHAFLSEFLLPFHKRSLTASDLSCPSLVAPHQGGAGRWVCISFPGWLFCWSFLILSMLCSSILLFLSSFELGEYF